MHRLHPCFKFGALHLGDQINLKQKHAIGRNLAAASTFLTVSQVGRDAKAVASAGLHQFEAFTETRDAAADRHRDILVRIEDFAGFGKGAAIVDERDIGFGRLGAFSSLDRLEAQPALGLDCLLNAFAFV